MKDVNELFKEIQTEQIMDEEYFISLDKVTEDHLEIEIVIYPNNGSGPVSFMFGAQPFETENEAHNFITHCWNVVQQEFKETLK